MTVSGGKRAWGAGTLSAVLFAASAWLSAPEWVSGVTVGDAGAPGQRDASSNGDKAPPPGPLAGPRPGRPEGSGPADQGGNRPFRGRRMGRFGQGDGGRPQMDGPNDDGGPDDGMGPDGEGNGERLQEMLSIIREKLPPGMSERLANLRQDHPMEFRRALRQLRPLIGEYLRLKAEHPDHPELAEGVFEEFRMEHQIRETANAYKQAKDSGNAGEMTRLEGELSQMIHRQFEVRSQRRQAQLQEFAQRLQKQQERLQQEMQRLQNDLSRSDQLIADRLDRIKRGELEEPRPDRGGPGGPGGPPFAGPDDRRRGPDGMRGPDERPFRPRGPGRGFRGPGPDGAGGPGGPPPMDDDDMPPPPPDDDNMPPPPPHDAP